MRKHLFTLPLLILCLFTKAQNIVLHNSGNNMYASPVSEIDSIKLDDIYSRFSLRDNINSLNIQKTMIDSITFSDNVITTDKIYIIYNGASDPTIINPYVAQGVVINTLSGAVSITATSGISNLEYHLLGTSTTASLTVNSTSPANFIMNNLNITNASGPAILVTGGQIHTFSSRAGTNNSLSDGSSNTKNGTLQTDGKIIFNGSGNLSVKAVKKHGISTASFIEVQNSNITVLSAASDGFHSEGYEMTGGRLNITSLADGIDAGDGNISISDGEITIMSTEADVKAIKTNKGTIMISGGTINLTVSGAQSKGISSKSNITFQAGNITATLSGAAVLTSSGSGYDASYASAVKSDSKIIINGGTVTIQGTFAATGARGLSADGNIEINDGHITITLAGNGATYINTSGILDSYSSSCIKTDASINILGGNITLSNTGNGGKGLNADGMITIGTATVSPTFKVTTKGNRFLVSGTNYTLPKTIVAKEAITITNGTNTIASTDDGIHSDASITINGGTNTISAIAATQGAGEGIEAPIINITGGLTKVTASNDGINTTYGTVSGGTEANDNSQLNISGGILIVTGSDAIDSNGDITITGGTTIVNGPASQPEEGIDYNGTFLMNEGLLISAGSNSSMTKAMGNTSAQVSLYLRSATQLPASTLFHIEDEAGTDIATFLPKNAVYYFHFSSSVLTKNTSYKIYFGGDYTGGTYIGDTSGWGLYTGGTYSSTGATLKRTFTTSNTNTVNTVIF